jgi:anti-sigma factor RsiW
MRSDRWPAGAYAAELEDEAAFVAAIASVRRQGFSRIEAYSPYPVPMAEKELGERTSPLPQLVFAAGVCGAAVGYAIQWYANAVSYPLNIGGRPAHAVPAFMIPAFEGLVLAAAIAAFVGLFALLRLPRPWHPIFEVEGFERASIDRFWIAIDATDPQVVVGGTLPSFEDLRTLRVVQVPADV